MRILKGYSKQERKELEEAKDNGFLSVMPLLYGIGEGYGDCRALSGKYYHEESNGNDQLVKDIADFYCGNAKFPEQKYYVQLIKNNDGSYLNKWAPNGFYMPGNCVQDKLTQTKFTEQEIKTIDPRYMAFAVPAEADDE